MTHGSIISKSIGYFLLVIMFYQFSCSALCAMSTNGCCSKEEREHHDKCCKSDENKSDDKSGDCQGMHFAFFKALGQFSSGKVADSPKTFFSFIAINHNEFLSRLVLSENHSIVYSGFKPPPKTDIRVFIQSFQI